MQFYWCFAVADGSGNSVAGVVEAALILGRHPSDALLFGQLRAAFTFSEDGAGDECSPIRVRSMSGQHVGLPRSPPNVLRNVLGPAHFAPTIESKSDNPSITSKTMQPMVSRDWMESSSLMLPSHPRVSTLT
jgi:hypothetical protein